MSFSGCSVYDYSSGHVPNLWPKGWLVVIMRVSTVLVQLKRQNLFCIEKCRCSERERGSSTPLGAAAAGGGGGGWRRGARRQYAPALHLSSIPAAPLQRAGVCRGIPRLAASPREAPAVDERRRRKRQRLRRACWRHRRRRTGHFDGTHTFNCFDLEIN